MKTKHKKPLRLERRRYAADPMALFRVIGRVTEFSPEEQAQINLPVRISLQAFMDGTGEEGDFHTLAGAMNVVLICAEKISPEVEAVANEALTAVAMLRREDGSYWQQVSDAGAASIAASLDVYEQLTSLLTGGQLKDAMVEVFERMRKQELEEGK